MIGTVPIPGDDGTRRHGYYPAAVPDPIEARLGLMDDLMAAVLYVETYGPNRDISSADECRAEHPELFR